MLKVDEIKSKKLFKDGHKKLLAQSVATIINGSLGMHYYGIIISLRHAGTQFDMKEQARVMHRTTWKNLIKKNIKQALNFKFFELLFKGIGFITESSIKFCYPKAL